MIKMKRQEADKEEERKKERKKERRKKKKERKKEERKKERKKKERKKKKKKERRQKKKERKKERKRKERKKERKKKKKMKKKKKKKDVYFNGMLQNMCKWGERASSARSPFFTSSTSLLHSNRKVGAQIIMNNKQTKKIKSRYYRLVKNLQSRTDKVKTTNVIQIKHIIFTYEHAL